MNNNKGLKLAGVFMPYPTYQRKTAFTLAEVLVTLGIIGVVSAMTVPSLMQNYQRQSYVTQLHKVYNEFSQAAMNVLTENNALSLKESPFNSGNLSVTTKSETFIKDHFKVISDCGTGLKAPCFDQNYKTLKGEAVSKENYTGCHSFVIANGASVCISGFSVSSAYVVVDINGQKGPNIAGRDYWVFNIYDDAVIDEGVTAACRTSSTCDMAEEREDFILNCEDAGEAPSGCFARLLNDSWQMTY